MHGVVGLRMRGASHIGPAFETGRCGAAGFAGAFGRTGGVRGALRRVAAPAGGPSSSVAGIGVIIAK
ncbi:hypothetical protein GCM10010326_30360 [Streptomyces xanthochromogenes]|uniref:Uncharacterized protein n=1 Tax=Streptomyces xanthochromogenes TaxID=67384 RepID=A0ABQ3A368_9ACTN|nr:hypothetical protein GCM10010326_30360 [Streptomyces xanthochromogenes]